MPSSEVIRDRHWRRGLGVVLAAVAFGFLFTLFDLFTLWVTRADYSHGLLIVGFAGYLLYRRRSLFPATIRHWPAWQGLPYFILGGFLAVAADQVNIAKEWVQAAALVLCLAGTVVMFCDRWNGLKWAWPALLFLPLAFPLPHRIEQTISLKLREIATQGANFLFQTAGLPSYTEGNKIIIDETVLNVAEPCSGLSMLLMFVALSTAIAILYESRAWIDRLIVLTAAVPIAVACNVLRIFFTGLVYHIGWTSLGDFLFHDLLGWLMAPMALGFSWLLLKAMDWVTEPVERLSTNEALGLPKKKQTAPPPAPRLETP